MKRRTVHHSVQQQQVRQAQARGAAASMQRLLESQGLVEAARKSMSVPLRREMVFVSEPNNYAEIYTHDEYGLVLDPKAWASDKCTTCNGRGFCWHVRLPKKDGEETHREMHPCNCAMRGYERVRGFVYKRLRLAVNKGEELTKIHRELGSELTLDVVVHPNNVYIGRLAATGAGAATVVAPTEPPAETPLITGT